MAVTPIITVRAELPKAPAASASVDSPRVIREPIADDKGSGRAAENARGVSGDTAKTEPKATGGSNQSDESTRVLRRELEQVEAGLQAVKHSVDELKPDVRERDWTPLVTALAGAVISAGVAVYSLQKNTRMTKRTLAEKSREEERQAIREQVGEFYSPFLQLRNASKFFYYEAFLPRRSQDELKNYGDADGNYRTVVALASGHKFDGVDATLLSLIVELGKLTADLIYSKIGLVDEPDLQQALARATTHFRIIEIAATAGARLSGVGDEVQKFTFPTELDERVQRKLDTLLQRLKTLQEG